MQRKNKLFLSAKKWRLNAIVLWHCFLFFTCLFFASATMAATNAKGIEIQFLTEESITAESTRVDTASKPTLTLTKTATISAAQSNLWARIEQGYGMPNIASPYTVKYENSYASRPAYVQKMMVRTEKYLFYVVEEVEKRGMPSEIALLPMIESAYNPNALSRSKAAGIWQFIPNTGRHFGLQQNWWADYRRDVTASTQAALNYLEKLHGMFGSWDLALAAYNAGQGTVGSAIEKNRRLGLPTDYQSLKLPVETAHYVPKLQAIKNIVTNPAQYGLNIAPIPNQAYFAAIDAPQQIDAILAAKIAGISQQEFASLNPRYKRPIIASKHNTHKLLLPVSAIEPFQNNLKEHKKSLISWKVYKAKRGEKISTIASNFNIRINHLRKVNGLSKKDRALSQTLHLLVPKGKSKAKKINVAKLANQKIRSHQKRVSHVTYKIKRGDTLSTLARRYGTNTRALMRMNRLKSTKLKIGQVIRIKGKRMRARTKRI